MTEPTPELRLLRVQELERIVGMSYGTIFRLEKRGLFPARHRISANITVWRSDEVFRWINEVAPRDDDLGA